MSADLVGIPLQKCASCGFEWFQLRDHDLPDGFGVLLINEEGRIGGWTGILVCSRCKEVLENERPPEAPLPRPTLRAIAGGQEPKP